jgi:hypothetical protein
VSDSPPPEVDLDAIERDLDEVEQTLDRLARGEHGARDDVGRSPAPAVPGDPTTQGHA